MKTNIKWPIGLITKYSTQLLNIHKAIYMNIHVRVYLLHAYMHSGNFARGWGQGPIFFIFQGVPTLFGGKGVQLLFYKETCGFSRVGGPDLLPPLDLRTTYIHVSLYKAFKCSRQYFFSKDIGFYSLLKILCRKNHYFIAFVLGSTSRNH